MRALAFVFCGIAALAACSSRAVPLQPGDAPPQTSWRGGVPSRLLDGYAGAQDAAEAVRRAQQAAGAAHAYDSSSAGGSLVRILPVTRRADGVATSTLVLYDTSGQWGYLGELYAIACANLAGHFGTADAEPVTAYASGQINNYTAVVYIGSTYYEPTADQIPPAFYSDVFGSTKPVIWINDNIWNFAAASGKAAFAAKYGWDPLSSFFQSAGTADITQVSYRGITLTRSVPSAHDAGLLRPAIVDASKATVLATASDGHGTSFPWAVRSGNLTYVGEIPFDYLNETDRAIAFGDLLFDALEPGVTQRHRALVRLDGVSAGSDPAVLAAVFAYLAQAHVPYVISVTPSYQDPLGRYHSGKAFSEQLAQAPKVVAALDAALASGAVLASSGFTHQYASVVNPYSGASPDDAEFFRAAAAGGAIQWNGPVTEDSSTWAQSRITSAFAAFQAAGFARPRFWTTPDYFASVADYTAIAGAFPERIERAVYFSGSASARSIDYSKYIGQFFPYSVTDMYGGYVVPENLGTYGPAHSAAAIVAAARANLAVRDGVAAFSYDPNFGVATLQSIVTQMQSMGYTFADPTTL